MNRTHTPEDIEKIQSGWHKSGTPELNAEFDRLYAIYKRNEVLEEVAKEFEKMPFGDTAASFAIFVRGMKK
jgi:hypothetical protein